MARTARTKVESTGGWLKSCRHVRCQTWSAPQIGPLQAPRDASNLIMHHGRCGGNRCSSTTALSSKLSVSCRGCWRPVANIKIVACNLPPDPGLTASPPKAEADLSQHTSMKCQQHHDCLLPCSPASLACTHPHRRKHWMAHRDSGHVRAPLHLAADVVSQSPTRRLFWKLIILIISIQPLFYIATAPDRLSDPA